LKANGKLPIISSHDAFIFDLDMTLVETSFIDCIYLSILSTISDLGGIQPSIDVASRFWYGSLNRDKCIRQRFGLDPATFWRVFRHYDTPEFRLAHTTVVPGVTNVLQTLRQKRKKLGIITASVAHMAEPEIAMLDFDFDACFSVSESPDFQPKPNPQSLHLMMQTLAVAPDRTLFTGDSCEDAHFSANAGVRFAHFDQGRGVTLPYQPSGIFKAWDNFLHLALEA